MPSHVGLIYSFVFLVRVLGALSPPPEPSASPQGAGPAGGSKQIAYDKIFV